MTNDTNTLNGALRELGETMAANLTTQGVPSTYDEGLTTLAGKILDITPGPGPTPTPASIDLTGTKSILSYVDSDSTVLTATVLDSSDNPVEGVDVNLYNGSTLWDTLTTDSSGEVSKTYSSAGSGDITFTAEVDGTLLTKTYALQDCLLYQDMSKIKSDWTKDTGVSGRTIYKLMTAYNTDVELTFKLQTSIPSNYLIGFGDTGGSPAYYSKCVFYNNNNTLVVFADNYQKSIGNPRKTTDTVFKLTTSNLHSISAYMDDVLKTTQSTSSSYPLNLRIDDFGNTLDIEYLKIKPL